MIRTQIWIEVALLEHWGPQPHGIPRVAQNLFLQSLRRNDVHYFYYHRSEKSFVATQNVSYFIDLASGRAVYDESRFPRGRVMSSQLCEEDSILFLEGGWDHVPYLSCVQSLRTQHPSVTIQYLLCDLIAIKFPQFFQLEFGSRVRDFLNALPSFSDRYVCISQSTANDVRALLSEHADTKVVRLGSDIHDSPGDVACGSPPYILSVGTIEVRKNHILLYYVWRRLAILLGDQCPKLMLIGRLGWIAGDVVSLFTNDPVVKDLVEIQHDVPDERLVELVRGSLFTVFPSFYEGWGLPLSEGYFYGKVCASSSTSSLPEINPFPELMFDPYNHEQAFEIIRYLIENPAKRKIYERQIATKFRRQTWENCFDELWGIISS